MKFFEVEENIDGVINGIDKAMNGLSWLEYNAIEYQRVPSFLEGCMDYRVSKADDKIVDTKIQHLKKSLDLIKNDVEIIRLLFTTGKKGGEQ